MAVKTNFALHEMQIMLADYDMGVVSYFSPLADGTVQTNYLVETSCGKYVLRYYENRTYKQVQFEVQLLQHLMNNHFPCAPIIPTASGTPYVYNKKPYVLFQFIEGEQIEYPNPQQRSSLIYTIADLAKCTESLKLKYADSRLSYNKPSLESLVEETVKQKQTANAYEKKEWYLRELSTLELPEDLSMGVCHCDYYYKNILYAGDDVKALLDFDDANYTYLFFDILSIIHFFKSGFDHENWNQFNRNEPILDFAEAGKTLALFEEKYPIPLNDKPHFFDILKLGILVDCLWYFDRGSYDDFFERRKIEAINQMGRDRFYNQLFG